MELSVLTDAISSIAFTTQSSGFSNFLLNRPENVLSLCDASSDQTPQSSPQFHISAASPPPTKTLTRRRTRKVRRARRKIFVGYDGEEDKLYLFGDGGNGSSGGGYFSNGGGGKGWNFGGHGGKNWEDFGDNSRFDPAFDFIYKILCWITMSNCLQFALRKVSRLAADGFVYRGKVPMRLTPVC